MDMVIAFHYLMNIISDKYANCFPGQDSGRLLKCEPNVMAHYIINISQSL